jgi:hypothetical protein
LSAVFRVVEADYSTRGLHTAMPSGAAGERQCLQSQLANVPQLRGVCRLLWPQPTRWPAVLSLLLLLVRVGILCLYGVGVGQRLLCLCLRHDVLGRRLRCGNGWFGTESLRSSSPPASRCLSMLPHHPRANVGRGQPQCATISGTACLHHQCCSLSRSPRRNTVACWTGYLASCRPK